MRTVALGPRPGELDAYNDRRKRLGIDTFDEVWEGSYHAAPAAHPSHGYVDSQLQVVLAPFAHAAGLLGTGPFNLGDEQDYRVPDGGYHRSLPAAVWVPTAAVVVEILSPDDETFEKFGFYAARGVDELLVADPSKRSVRCWHLSGAGYLDAVSSELLGVTTAQLTEAIAWP